MGGKAAVFLVMGFSLIFLVVGQNFNSMSVDSIDNYTTYYRETNAHNIAVSGANMAASEIFFDPSWDDGINNLSYNGGKINVSLQVLDAFKNLRQITASGTYEGVTKTVKVAFQPSKFSKFAYFSEIEGSNIWWTTGDTVWGPMHLQDYLRVAYKPVFMGKVTTKKRIKYYNWRHDDPKFYGGYEQGVNIVLPPDKVKDMETVADMDGAKFVQDSVYLTFAGDSIRYRFSKTGTDTTVLGSDLTNNGVIYIKHGTCRIQGVVKGQYSLVSWGPDPEGRIYIDDDIVYHDNPLTNPNSTDMLGLIARNDILITDNAANSSDVNIHASIYSEMEGFGAENYDSRGVCGNINLLGGIIQKKRQAVGTFSYWGMNNGFNKKYKYDERLMLASPPHFPGTGEFEIVSWYE